MNKYLKLGNNYRNAQNLAAEEIILNKIASSSLSESVTLKGGIVMYNLTKNNRRVTQDIDFDLIRYSIDETSIRLFIDKLSTLNDGITVLIKGPIEKLHQEDYQGVRVNLLIKDTIGDSLRIKLDIGVHTYFAIEQEKTIFSFESGERSISINVNPCEQIFAEKILSLARLGPLSTRYKDVYDLYYLIQNNLLNIEKVKVILNLFFIGSKRQPKSIIELTDSLVGTFENKNFLDDISEPAHKWLDVSSEDIKKVIIDFIDKL